MTMRQLPAVLLVAALFVAADAALAQSDEVRVAVLDATGKVRGGVGPRSEPDPSGEGGGYAFLMGKTGPVRDRDGESVFGFKFASWKRSTGVRVAVFSLVPREGDPTPTMSELLREANPILRLRSKPLVTHDLVVGQTRVVDAMKAFGVEPYQIRVEIRPTQ